MRSEEILHFNHLKDVLCDEELFIVLDRNIKNLYKKKLDEIFEAFKYPPVIFDSFDGEKDKSLEKYDECVSFFLAHRIHRKARVLAIGGGATSDFAGFVASTILRGVSWSIVPTTLLSMVDAAIGGKTGLNVVEGKNLIGSFYTADHVFYDTSFLKTLTEEEVISGKGEILKYALLDKNIYDQVMSNSSLEDLIFSCAHYKRKIVEIDFKEQGQRILLNLGHTFGHAFERCFKMAHGKAVIEGIILKDKLLNNSGLEDSLRSLLLALNIDGPQLSGEDIKNFASKIIDFIAVDKKRGSKDIVNVLIPVEIGNVKIEEISIEKIAGLLNS
ncbi:MAG: 3-dehydroquinate synthase [Bacteriovoracaceae bacterium]